MAKLCHLDSDFKEFPCGYCDKTFKNEADMIQHIEDKHQPDEHQVSDEEQDENPDFDVSFCNQSVISDSIIDTFECFPCRKEFKSEESLAEHIKDAHDKCTNQRQRKHPCNQCSKSFYTKSDLWSHLRIHSGSKYTCQQCGKQLASSGSLHNHHKSVHQEHKQFECHVCFKTFALKQKLVNHVMTEHEGQKPFQCVKCHQGFVHKQSYEAHQRRHNGQALPCSQCSKSFHDAGYLKKHLRKHEKSNKAQVT